MSTTTESPFSLTIKVGPNNDLLTGRAETRDEMLQRIVDLQILKAEIELPGAQPNVQPNVQHIAPATVEQAVQNLAAGGLTGTVEPAGIEQRDDRWGNKYTRGMPDAGTCMHGARIVKNGVSKAGKAYKAYVCVNDSPFGDYKAGKCDAAWPAR